MCKPTDSYKCTKSEDIEDYEEEQEEEELQEEEEEMQDEECDMEDEMRTELEVLRQGKTIHQWEVIKLQLINEQKDIVMAAEEDEQMLQEELTLDLLQKLLREIG